MSDPHVTILMATRNGARFLPAQLQSLLGQTHSNWSLIVSDDGSTDGTPDLLRAFDRGNPDRNLRLVQGPRQGASAPNFMRLLARVAPDAGLVALADQDDVWLPDKLARAVAQMQDCPQDVPIIYATESLVTDAHLIPLRQKPVVPAQPSFRNALVQNLFAGHSTVLNAAAVALVQRAGTPQNIVFHDWWLYQLVAGAGGLCLLDPAQTVLYRQHGGNAFGASQGLRGACKRIGHLLRNEYGIWLEAHWRALREAAPCLTPEARDLVRDLLSPTPDEPRSAQFRRLGLHRGTRRGSAGLWLAARLRRA